jgi:solute carrier family 25 iron transporter 28/37
MFLNPERTYDPFSHVISGALSGGCAAAVTNPLDVVKTLLQTKGSIKDVQIRNTSGAIDAFKLIYDREGVRGFLKGMRPRMIAHMPSTAICWTVYEYFKWYLNRND